jgi:hypothetical protein
VTRGRPGGRPRRFKHVAVGSKELAEYLEVEGYARAAQWVYDRLVPLRSLADSELSGNALAVAAKRGRLRAVRRPDQWYSTKQWVQEYKERRYKRG